MILGLQNRSPAKATIQELGQAIAQAELGVALQPSISLAAWHAERARHYKTAADSSWGTFSYTAALDSGTVGLFHARLCVEVVAEYRAVRERLSGTALPAPSDSDVSVIALAASGGAHDTTSPEYTQDSDAEVAKGMRQMRRLALMIARVHGVSDALIGNELEGFIEANPELERALAYLKKAENADDWSKTYDSAWDGYCFAELAFNLTCEFLKAKNVAFELNPAAWEKAEPAEGDSYDDEEDSSNDESYNDALSSITEAATATLRARLRLEANDHLPTVAAYHLGLAQKHLDDGCQNYDEQNFPGAEIQADQAYFFARLALETIAVYNQEANRVAGGGEPTDDPDAPEGSEPYCSYNDPEIQIAFENWRNLGISIASVQAFYAVNKLTYEAGLEQLNLAQKQVEAAENTDSWKDIPGFADEGFKCTLAALQMGKAYLQGRRDERDTQPAIVPIPSIH